MLKGIDVSALSGNIDWDRVKAAGNDFCFIRAAYGDAPDLSAAGHLRNARRSGLACGVYHLLRVSKDAAAQVALMKSLVTTLEIGPGDLPPVVDVEDNPHYDGLWEACHNQPYLAMVADWTSTMHAQLGAPPIVYTRASFWTQLGNPVMFQDNPLWVAHYCEGKPTLPAPWNAFTFWQHSENAVVDGVAGRADLSYFNGDDPGALRALRLK
jgi:lysozyme